MSNSAVWKSSPKSDIGKNHEGYDAIRKNNVNGYGLNRSQQNNNYSSSFMSGFFTGNKKSEELFSLQYFEKYKDDLAWKNKNKEDGKELTATALRKIYDAYMDIINSEGGDLQIKIWIAKIGYQEGRKILPVGFTNFLDNAYTTLGKDQFTEFLEVFVAYHKYFKQD